MTLRFALTLVIVCFLVACGPALAAADGPAVAGTDRPVESGSPPVPSLAHSSTAYEVTTGQSVARDLPARQSPSLSGLQGPPETDATVTRVRVLPNGTAVWSLTIRMQLDSTQAEEDFEAFVDEFETNRSTYIDSYRNRMTNVVANAENATGREMEATGFEAEIGTESVPRRWGFVTYQFRWDGFAPVESDAVSVGDVFGNGFFLEETDILILQSPDGYEPATVDPDPDSMDDGELRWEGPVSFGDNRPSAQFAPADSSTDDSTGDDSTDDSPDGSPDDSPGDSTDDGTTDGGSPLPGSLLFGTAGVAVLVGAAAFYLHRRRQPDSGGSPSASEATDAKAGDGGTVPDASEGAQAATAADEMPDLATDEDRVLAALEDEDGRMRQSDLADELGWSPSKTSRVLSNMADEGEVEKLRIGRENVIDLVPDDE